MLRKIAGHARLTMILAAGLLLTTSIVPGSWIPTAHADTKISRVTKNALYGAGLGLLLGSVTALVVDKDNRDDSIRWGVVLGTFAGFGYGVYSVATGTDDDFFLAHDSASPEPNPFDARTHFVGAHAHWVAETATGTTGAGAEKNAVTRPSGLLQPTDPAGGPNHAAAFQLVTE